MLVGQTVSFDFDETLTRSEVRDYAEELVERGVNVIVVTSRYDDLHIPHNKWDNSDLFLCADLIGIPRERVRFMNMEMKCKYFFRTNVLWHLDDDVVEIEGFLADSSLTTVPINVGNQNWRDQCEAMLS